MDIFEYISKKLKEELDAFLEEIPELLLELNEIEWEQYFKGDIS